MAIELSNFVLTITDLKFPNQFIFGFVEFNGNTRNEYVDGIGKFSLGFDKSDEEVSKKTSYGLRTGL